MPFPNKSFYANSASLVVILVYSDVRQHMCWAENRRFSSPSTTLKLLDYSVTQLSRIYAMLLLLLFSLNFSGLAA